MSVSGDGRLVAFWSDRRDLDATPPAHPEIPLFVHDRHTGRTHRLIRSLRAQDGETLPPLVTLDGPQLSVNGKFVCVYLTEDPDEWPWMTGRVAVVDVGSGEATVIPGRPHDPHCSVTDDGRRVAYATDESHDPADTNEGAPGEGADTYVFDLAGGSWTLVSRATGREGAVANLNQRQPNYTNFGSFRPEITPEGRYIAFWSRASNLSAEDDDDAWDIFVRDAVADTTEWVSRADGLHGGPGVGYEAKPGNNFEGAQMPSISDDGRYVAFASDQLRLDPSYRPQRWHEFWLQAYRRDRVAGTTEVISQNIEPDSGYPVYSTWSVISLDISGDGRYVTYTAPAQQRVEKKYAGEVVPEVFLRDAATDTTALISRGSGVFGVISDSHSYMGSINGDGSLVAFESDATNLAAGGGGRIDIFTREPLSASGVLPTDLAGRPEIESIVVRVYGVPGSAVSARRRPRVALRYRLDEYAQLTIKLRRRGRHGVRTARIEGHPGRNATRLRFRRLRPGRYSLVVRARDLAGLRSRSRRISFRVSR